MTPLRGPASATGEATESESDVENTATATVSVNETTSVTATVNDAGHEGANAHALWNHPSRIGDGGDLASVSACVVSVTATALS
jgi:hypothetical protein